MVLCGDSCDGCDGCDCVVDVVDEGDSSPVFALRAAITSPRKLLFLRRDNIFSAVSGLLYKSQRYSRISFRPMFLLGTSAFSPTIGFERVATLMLVGKATLTGYYIRIISGTRIWKTSSPWNAFTALLLCFAATQARCLLPTSIVWIRTAHGAQRATAHVNPIWHVGEIATSVL